MKELNAIFLQDREMFWQEMNEHFYPRVVIEMTVLGMILDKAGVPRGDAEILLEGENIVVRITHPGNAPQAKLLEFRIVIGKYPFADKEIVSEKGTLEGSMFSEVTRKLHHDWNGFISRGGRVRKLELYSDFIAERRTIYSNLNELGYQIDIETGAHAKSSFTSTCLTVTFGPVQSLATSSVGGAVQNIFEVFLMKVEAHFSQFGPPDVSFN